jgi:hypothetical protein
MSERFLLYWTMDHTGVRYFLLNTDRPLKNVRGNTAVLRVKYHVEPTVSHLQNIRTNVRVSAHKMAWWTRRQLLHVHSYAYFCFTTVWITKQNESHLIQPANSSQLAFLSNVVLSLAITSSSPLLLLLLLKTLQHAAVHCFCLVGHSGLYTYITHIRHHIITYTDAHATYFTTFHLPFER